MKWLPLTSFKKENFFFFYMTGQMFQPYVHFFSIYSHQLIKRRISRMEHLHFMLNVDSFPLNKNSILEY